MEMGIRPGLGDVRTVNQPDRMVIHAMKYKCCLAGYPAQDPSRNALVWKCSCITMFGYGESKNPKSSPLGDTLVC